MCTKALQLGDVDEAFAYNLKDVDPYTLSQHKQLFGNTRTFGFLAKDYFLRKAAHRYPEGTVIIWLDSDIALHSLKIFGCLAQNSPKGVAGFHTQSFLEKWFTKRDTLLDFNMDNTLVRNTVQSYGGILSFVVSNYTRALMDELFRESSNPQHMLRNLPSVRKPEHKAFWSDKEDQSI